MFFQVVESFFKTTLRKRKVQRFHFYVCVCAIHRRSIDPKMKATKNKRVELSNQSPHTASHFYFNFDQYFFSKRIFYTPFFVLFKRIDYFFPFTIRTCKESFVRNFFILRLKSNTYFKEINIFLNCTSEQDIEIYSHGQELFYKFVSKITI